MRWVILKTRNAELVNRENEKRNSEHDGQY